MKTKGSLPYSHEPATSPCPDPDESSPHHPITYHRCFWQIK